MKTLELYFAATNNIFKLRKSLRKILSRRSALLMSQTLMSQIGGQLKWQFLGSEFINLFQSC